MGKSIRSKIKKRFRTIKRTKVTDLYDKRDEERAEKLKVEVAKQVDEEEKAKPAVDEVDMASEETKAPRPERTRSKSRLRAEAAAAKAAVKIPSQQEKMELGLEGPGSNGGKTEKNFRQSRRQRKAFMAKKKEKGMFSFKANK